VSKVAFFLLFFSGFLEAVDGSFYISGQVVKKISLSLAHSSIDFGDVYHDSDVASEEVDFSVNAENGFDYTIAISNDDSTGVVQVSRTASAGYTADIITYIETATGVEQAHKFYVDLNTSNMSGDLSAKITVLVVYNDIAE
jgi:hypothetical protein